jgi:hypothetical protein
MTKYAEDFPRQHADNLRMMGRTQSMWTERGDMMRFWTAPGGGELASDIEP